MRKLEDLHKQRLLALLKRYTLEERSENRTLEYDDLVELWALDCKDLLTVVNTKNKSMWYYTLEKLFGHTLLYTSRIKLLSVPYPARHLMFSWKEVEQYSLQQYKSLSKFIISRSLQPSTWRRIGSVDSFLMNLNNPLGFTEYYLDDSGLSKEETAIEILYENIELITLHYVNYYEYSQDKNIFNYTDHLEAVIKVYDDKQR